MKGYRKGEASRYRAIETRAWDYFAGLDSDSAKLLLYLWISPHSTPYGILRLKEGYVLTDLAWEPARLQTAWQVLENADLAWRDGNLVVLVPFLQSNPPANENVTKRWRKDVALLPESPLFGRIYQKASAWVTEDGLAWLTDKFPRPFPNGSETLPELRAQSSETRAQGPATKTREQGTGGIQGGEGEGPAPYPIPSPTASPDRAADVTESPSDASSLPDRKAPAGTPNLLQLFALYGPGVARKSAKAQGYTKDEIDAAERKAANTRSVTQDTA